MTLFDILLEVGIFAVMLHLLIRWVGLHIQLSLAVLLIVAGLILGPIFFDTLEDPTNILPWVMYAWIFLYVISILFQTRKTGKLVSTYKQDQWNMFWRLVTAASSVFLAYMLLRSKEYIFENDITEYFRIVLPLGIVAVFLAIIQILFAFRKGEFRENGIVTPDLGYFSWNGYKAYEWVGYTRRNKRQFLLYLEGARNETVSIDHISEQEKSILEELLSKKLPQLNPST